MKRYIRSSEDSWDVRGYTTNQIERVVIDYIESTKLLNTTFYSGDKSCRFTKIHDVDTTVDTFGRDNSCSVSLYISSDLESIQRGQFTDKYDTARSEPEIYMVFVFSFVETESGSEFITDIDHVFMTMDSGYSGDDYDTYLLDSPSTSLDSIDINTMYDLINKYLNAEL